MNQCILYDQMVLDGIDQMVRWAANARVVDDDYCEAHPP
jgi:hypothetical protein